MFSPSKLYRLCYMYFLSFCAWPLHYFRRIKKKKYFCHLYLWCHTEILMLNLAAHDISPVLLCRFCAFVSSPFLVNCCPARRYLVFCCHLLKGSWYPHWKSHGQMAELLFGAVDPGLHVFPYASPTCFGDCSFISLEVRECESSNFFLIFHNSLG